MNPARRPGTRDYQALASFRHLIRRFQVFSDDAARSAGLEPRHHQVLLAVKGLPSGGLPTIGALAWQLQLKHHSVVELTHRMARLDLLRRHRNRADLREVLIEVSPRGERLLRKLSLIHREELRRAAPEILPALSHIFADAPPEYQFIEKEDLTWPNPSPRRRPPTPPSRKATCSSETSQPQSASSRSASSRSGSAP